jgi:hypothetical protein
LTCFLAPRLDRDAIFEAMRARHHYATTGNRMLLDVTVTTPNDAAKLMRKSPGAEVEKVATKKLIMGDIAEIADSEVTLDVGVVGSAPIERLDIFRGTELIETLRPYAEGDLQGRVRMTMEGAEYRGRARTTVWDGSLSISGNEIKEARMFNNWNLDRGIRSARDTQVDWKAVTTGNVCGIDLWLADPRSGSIAIETPHVSPEIAIADVGLEETVFEAGGLERKVKVYRLPDDPGEVRLKHNMTVSVQPQGDTPLFVRVTQVDGHRAWSSPVYLVRK